MTNTEWATTKISAVSADLSRLQATLASAETIARCLRGPGAERALLAAGIDQLTADAICTRGWRDGRPALRRAIATAERRIERLRAFAARSAA